MFLQEDRFLSLLKSFLSSAKLRERQRQVCTETRIFWILSYAQPQCG